MTISAAELLVYTRAVGAVDTELAIAALGVSVAAAGVESVKMAGDFQASMTKLVTSASEPPQYLKMIKDGILQMSIDTATSTKQLADGMFNIASSSIYGADGLKVLKIAAEGAKAENADLAAVTDVLTTSLHAFHLPVSQAADVMNSLIKTVGIGKMHMDELTSAFTNVLPVASIAKVKITDVEAALATMSYYGDKGSIAGTHLAQMLTYLNAPSSKATAALKEVGLTTQQISDEMKVSLPDTIKMITDAVGEKFPASSPKYIAALSAIVGGQKSARAIFELSGQSLNTFIDDAKKLAPTMTANSTAIENWGLIQKNFNFQLEAAQNAVSVLMIKLGTALLPTLGQILTKVTPLITSFGDWVVKNHVVENSLSAVGTAITNTVGFIQNMIKTGTSVVQFFQNNQLATAALGVAIGALGGVMALFVASSVADMILSLLDYGLSMLTAASETVTAATVMTSTFAEMSGMIIASMGTTATAILSTLGPFLLVGAVVAAVGAGVVLAIMHWGEISTWFQATWASTVQWFNGAMQNMGAAIQGVMAWFDAWKQPIIAVAESITFFFLPALLIAGTQAVIAGAKIVGSFVASMVMTGITATNNALLVTADFITSMIETGTAAVVSGAKVTASFVASMVVAGWQAVVAGAKITYTFVASLIATGIAGWTAAGGLVPFVAGLIASGVQGVIAAGAMLTSVVPALQAVGVAAYASLGPIGLILGAIALTITAFTLMKQKSDEMQLGVTGAFDTMGNKVQRSTGRIMVSADQMKTNVSNSTNQLKQNVSTDMLNAMNSAVNDSQTMSTTASALWQKFNKNATASLASLDSSTISYMNSIAGYIDKKSAEAAMVANENFASIHVPSFSGSAILHNFNDSSNFTGHAEGITNNPVGHWAMIGERGPEKMYIPRGASIIPNNQLNSMSSSNSPSHASSNNADRPLILQIDGRTFARVILPALTDQIRYGVGSVGI